MPATMFSTQEAVSFLEDNWGIQHVQQRFHDHNDRKALLEEIVKSIQAHVPFQSVTLMATPPEQRKRPSVEQIKEECEAGIGGLCYNINAFTWGLLRGIGFDARLNASGVTSTDDHLIVIIYDLEKKGDIHLVDCGVGFATFRAIDLNFKEESPAFVDSFLEYKYILKKGFYVRIHGTDKVKGNNPLEEMVNVGEGRWKRFYSFELKPSNDLSDFDTGFDKVFTVPGLTPFHHSVRAMAYPNKKAVILVSNKLMVEVEGGEMETTTLDGDQAIVDKYCTYFPSLPEEVVSRALNQWRSLKQN